MLVYHIYVSTNITVIHLYIYIHFINVLYTYTFIYVKYLHIYICKIHLYLNTNTCHVFLVHSFVVRHLGCFYTLARMNNAAVIDTSSR